MLIPIFGLLIGIIAGIFFTVSPSAIAAQYLAVIAMAALDTTLEAYKQSIESIMDKLALLFGFIATVCFSCLLVFFSGRTGLDIYLVAAVAIGIRIYKNLNSISTLIVQRYREKQFIQATTTHFTSED